MADAIDTSSGETVNPLNKKVTSNILDLYDKWIVANPSGNSQRFIKEMNVPPMEATALTNELKRMQMEEIAK